VASKIDLPDQFVYYFGLYLVGKESEDDFSSNFVCLIHISVCNVCGCFCSVCVLVVFHSVASAKFPDT